MNRLLISLVIFLSLIISAQAEIITLTASWYSVQSLKDEGTYKYSQGRMANGKFFNDDAFTCASRDWSIGTRLLVRNKANGKEVRVVVTDRIGKRFKGKRIDLSKRAFGQIACFEQGIVSVEVRQI